MFHTIIIAGYLGRDPESRVLPNGNPVTNFSVASSRKWTGQNGEQQEETVWFRVAVFGAQAESCYRYLSKGRAVLVEGRLRPDESGNPRTFTRNDGSTGASFEVTAQTVRFLGGGNGGNGNAAANAPQEGDEIPF